MRVRKLALEAEKDGKVSYWLESKSYETAQFALAWARIGCGL